MKPAWRSGSDVQQHALVGGGERLGAGRGLAVTLVPGHAGLADSPGVGVVGARSASEQRRHCGPARDVPAGQFGGGARHRRLRDSAVAAQRGRDPGQCHLPWRGIAGDDESQDQQDDRAEHGQHHGGGSPTHPARPDRLGRHQILDQLSTRGVPMKAPATLIVASAVFRAMPKSHR